MKSDQERWDQRWQEKKDKEQRPPHPLLIQFLDRRLVAGGRALDLACGIGQEAIWLARQGFRVDGVDISRVAIERGQEAAAAAGVQVNFAQADLDEWSPEDQAYDLITCFRFLDRRLWSRLRGALKPRGWLVYLTFNIRRLGPQSMSPVYLLEIGELERTFADWRILEAGDAQDQSWIICQKP